MSKFLILQVLVDFRFLLGQLHSLNCWKVSPFHLAMWNLELTPNQLAEMILKWAKFHLLHFWFVHLKNKVILIFLYIPISGRFFIKNTISTNNYPSFQIIVQKIVGIYVLKLVDCKYNPLTAINKLLLIKLLVLS